MRIMSMDVGDKRIGLAVSDALGYTAQGLDTLYRKDISYDIEQIRSLVNEYNPDKIVIGLPKNMNGTIGEQGNKTMEFGNRLKNVLNLEIVYWDERLTSASAHRALSEGNVNREKRKKNVDKLAAIFILQSYLDCNSKK